MYAEPMSLARCALPGNDEGVVAVHAGQTISRQRFCTEVAERAAALILQSQQRYALYYEAAYPFAVSLYALMHAGKSVWIPGNNCPATAEKLTGQGCRLLGEWPEAWSSLMPPDSKPHSIAMTPLDSSKVRLTLFTSGSGGHPKAIAKTLQQLQQEVEILEQQWGRVLGRAAAAATVNHQHIYGLLFRLLWPLAAGRCFHSQMFLSPEPMLKAIGDTPSYWVASPAQLKRLDAMTAWPDIARLAAVFSSGGPLSEEAAWQIERQSGQKVIELYGSSETGGIGWRQAVVETSWSPLPGITLTKGSDDRCLLNSPFLPEALPYRLDDRIELHEGGRFSLSGRLDRIVKVEEKRLSLDELERALAESEWVVQAYTLLLADRRDRIAAAVVLSEAGKVYLFRTGRTAVIRELRVRLMQTFEAVVLPRKWLFIDSLPLSTQGKVDNVLLRRLFSLDSVKFPQLLYCQWEGKSVKLELRIQPELIYFSGHFPGQPILPGVTQLAWAERYGRIFFAIEQPFLTMEVIKFKKIIQPEALMTLTLEWKADSGKLYFDLSSAADSHSSGRMVYGARS
ncbi:MAG: AMP-binding protein [Gammaproteobacteria bacterium]